MFDGNRPIINKNAYVLDGYYSLVYGPITVLDGVTVTIGSDADVKVVDWSDY